MTLLLDAPPITVPVLERTAALNALRRIESRCRAQWHAAQIAAAALPIGSSEGRMLYRAANDYANATFTVLALRARFGSRAPAERPLPPVMFPLTPRDYAAIAPVVWPERSAGPDPCEVAKAEDDAREQEEWGEDDRIAARYDR